MQEIEDLLLSWKNSLPEDSILSNDYSIEDDSVILTVSRCINQNDIGESLVEICPLQKERIISAINYLSSNRERLCD